MNPPGVNPGMNWVETGRGVRAGRGVPKKDAGEAPAQALANMSSRLTLFSGVVSLSLFSLPLAQVDAPVLTPALAPAADTISVIRSECAGVVRLRIDPDSGPGLENCTVRLRPLAASALVTLPPLDPKVCSSSLQLTTVFGYDGFWLQRFLKNGRQ